MFFTNNRSLLLSCLVTLVEVEAARIPSRPKSIAIQQSSPRNAGIPLDSFVSFSFEFSSWPDFAGNLSNPNAFTGNLLSNLGKLQGSMPYVRVGGNTQDWAVFDESQKTNIIGIIQPEISTDYPTIITFGPSYFESYQTMPQGIKYAHGLNMAANTSVERTSTFHSAAYACKAIGGNLLYWEYGNEADLFNPSRHRPRNYTEADYVSEWLNGTKAIKDVVKVACPELAGVKFMGPSFAGPTAVDIATLNAVKAWREGINKDDDIGIVALHNYMGVSTSPGITLQGTLMNHTNVKVKAETQFNLSRGIRELDNAPSPDIPIIMGEHNSLARQGRPGLSNSFGAALWGIDWNLYLASHNISRSHMHQGTNYRYQAWQPIETNRTTKGTKPPYYGSVAIAAFMHRELPSNHLSISHLDSSSEFSTQYAAYINSTLARILLVDLHTYNTTDNNYTTPFPRPVEGYELKLPGCSKGKAQVQRLIANGSDAITGITWDGYSYNYELDEGKPVRLNNVTRGEKVKASKDGVIRVDVPWSSAAIVTLDC
ncbi:glycoside hydrolase family 79 protein [Bipolaris oryzae ATCC 44560]|uniref:Glycoside hydrolase family 79 protein n=1 Tax=Bipolaris oryzae ATCC 44560 TaxID=930090 RepID=W6Z4V0_COCMI|nr:glycoside hydrolase family 79 protein [Bipolaris oryzae ATCC 44560]EUC44768.1 glycoside hydrolase family 79 protein [Bipolaris oryzae ATCC 44560]